MSRCPDWTALAARREAEPAGWLFLNNYTRKAIANEEARYGRLPDHDDLERIGKFLNRIVDVYKVEHTFRI